MPQKHCQVNGLCRFIQDVAPACIASAGVPIIERIGESPGGSSGSKRACACDVVHPGVDAVPGVDVGRDPLSDAVTLWHEKLSTFSPSLHLKWVECFGKFLNRQCNTISVGTMFSGCDVLQVVLQELKHQWHHTYDFEVYVDHKFMCERTPAKQQFLLNRFSPALLFTDASELGNILAHDMVSGQQQPVPILSGVGSSHGGRRFGG